MRIGVWLLAATIALTGCSSVRALPFMATQTPIPCRMQAPEFLPALDALISEWSDTDNSATRLASSAERSALNGLVGRLQDTG